MHLSLSASESLARAVVKEVPLNRAVVVLCPSFTSIAAVTAIVHGTLVKVGAQDVSAENEGSFTGQISAAMLKDIGCGYAIIGHSERRRNLGESNELIRKKVIMALSHGLVPILCVGESQEEREAGDWEAVIAKQLQESLSGIALDNKFLIVAYEPVWAIGTGKIVTTDDVRAAVRGIRQLLDGIFGHKGGNGYIVIYGGSVDPVNVRHFVGNDLMDGVLVGTDSLKAEEFNNIIKEVVS
ncbi:MAG: Triosephosphate isomerase [Parcubacteria group bacterium GW2011_GWA2_46_9]|nr:MAG: Triosephosphate isomerase [Parcubacteria group bacterium GW2011_GWA2_46_9]